jgi:predicted ester cyclase
MRSAPGPVTTAPRRPRDIKPELAMWFDCFPDIRVEIEYQTTFGDQVFTQCVISGTHRKTWLGITPTNRKVFVRMVLRQRIADDKIIEDWLLADWHGFLAQLGALPPLEQVVRRE